MQDDLFVKNGIIIPGHELDTSFSRSSGHGGQNVNKVSTRVTIRWNVLHSAAVTEEQRSRLLYMLKNHISHEGDFIVHSSASRSQHQNIELARAVLAKDIAQALYVPKRRMKSIVPGAAKERRLESKSRRSNVKKMRKVNIEE